MKYKLDDGEKVMAETQARIGTRQKQLAVRIAELEEKHKKMEECRRADEAIKIQEARGARVGKGQAGIRGTPVKRPCGRHAWNGQDQDSYAIKLLGALAL
jgi:hypothetical protein